MAKFTKLAAVPLMLAACADNAGANTISSSERKAWTSASLKTPTQARWSGR